MAYKVIRSAKDDYQIGREITAVLDSASDLATLIASEGTLAPGSIATVVGKGMPTYVLNASGEWKNVDGSSGGGGVLDTLSVVENGSYVAGSGDYSEIDGWNEVVVDVPAPTPVLQDISVTENGAYTADPDYDGLGEVTVDVSVTPPVLSTLAVSTNGQYEAGSGSYSDVEGWNEVTVNVPDPPPEFMDAVVSTQSLSTKLANPVLLPLGDYANILRAAINLNGLVNVMAQALSTAQLLSSASYGKMQLTFQGMGTQIVPVAAVINSSGATPALHLSGGAYDSANDMAVYYAGVVDNTDMLQFTKLVIVQNGTAQDMTAQAGQLVSDLSLDLSLHVNLTAAQGD